MKVCMISGAYPAMRCGIGDYAGRLAAELAGRGVAVDVLARRNPLVEPGSHPQVRVFPVLSAVPGLDAPLIARHARKQNCNIIHIQYPTWPFRRSLTISLLPALLRMLGAGPVAVTFHEVARCHPINRLRLVPIACTSAAITATTVEDCGWLCRRLPWVARRVVHIPIGTHVEPRDEAASGRSGYDRDAYRRKLGIRSSETAMCYFGFVLRNKLIEDMLAAFRKVIDSGEKVRLVFMSGIERTEGSYGADVLKLIDALRLAGHVTHTGFLSLHEVWRCLSACDFASLLFRDGVSFRRSSVLAAMANGLPVVSCRSGPVPEGLAQGENVLLSDVGDIEGLSENMLKLCRDTQLRRKLRRGSLETAGKFSWRSIVGQTIRMYRRLLR